MTMQDAYETVTTKGHGVSVHRKDCSKYIEAMKNGIETDRWVEVTWAENAAKNDNPIFKATLDVVSYDNISLLANVTAVTAEMRIPVSELTTKMLKNGNATILTISGLSWSRRIGKVWGLYWE